MVNAEKSLMSVRGLTKVFKSGVFRPKYTVAVEDVSFDLKPGTTLSLIGESGSGKTTIGKLILKLLKPTAGHIYYKDRDIGEITEKNEVKAYYRKVRGSSRILSPPLILCIGWTGFEMLFTSLGYDQANKDERIHQVLNDVNLNADSSW